MAEENESGGSDVGSHEIVNNEAFNLEIEELDDAEYAIPAVENLPSLESILAEPDGGSLSGADDEIGAVSTEKLAGSETASMGSLLSLTSQTRTKQLRPLPASGIILRHVILKGICAQIASANERINAGLASAVAAGGNMLVIGTSHGLVLGFDSAQTLRWCDQEARHQGSVSALCFNHDGTRILAGFAKGYILMIDSSNGKVLRTLTDVHPPGTAVLHVKFTDSPKLALCSDSGGSVFELSFTRVMGVRGCESKCLFSGSRGEVCCLEPLLLNDHPIHPLKNYTLIAMATLSKVIVVCIRPRMRVVLTYPLGGAAIAPPQVSWQLVVIQAPDSTRSVDPVLALGRDTTIHFYQVCSEAGSRVRLTPLRRVVLTYTMSNLRWMNSRSLAVLDVHERLHLVDVRTQEDLETLDMSNVGISYASSHFKGLTTGGNVSKAMALAGERACYNTVLTYGTQLLLLGTKSLHAVCIRTWTERLRHLTLQRRYPEALALGLDFYRDKGKAVVGLRGSKQRRKQIARDKVCQVLVQYMDELPNSCASAIGDSSYAESDVVSSILSTCVEYCVQLENTDLLFGKFWEMVAESDTSKGIYLRALEAPLLDGSLPPRLPPFIAQQLVTLYDKENRLEALQAIVILLAVDCLDIHQVTTVCRRRGLWEALIHLQTAALGDFTAPIHQLLPVLHDALPIDRPDSTQLKRDSINLGNALLVYASCCLAGRDFPRQGELPEGLSRKIKADVLRALLSQHSSLANDTERQYPYLRTLLKFDAKGFLDVIAMAFQEPEFTSEIGLRQRQRIVDILLSIVIPTTPISPENPDYLTGGRKMLVLVFVTSEVSESTVSLEPNTLNRVVEFLTSNSNEEDSTKVYKTQRENAIIELLQNKKLTNMSDKTLLTLAHRSKFWRVAELLYSSQDDWISMFRCMLAESSRHCDIFPRLDQLPTTALYSVVSAHAVPLVEMDADRTASLISSRLAPRLSGILQCLSKHPKQEYTLLGALYNLFQHRGEREDEQEDVRGKKERKNEEIVKETGKFELSGIALEKYLKLMCEFEPEKVVRHLRGPHGCRLDEALRIVQEMKHEDAEAVMLEDLGNYEDAFSLLLRRLKNNLASKTDNESDSSDEETVRLTSQLAGLCRRSAGSLDWMPLVETVLSVQSNGIQKGEEILRGQLLKIILESLSGTTALSSVLEQILKHPLANSGTIGDMRQLLAGVLAQSRYEQILVHATSRLVSLELHEALKKSLKEAGKARSNSSLICPICRKVLSHSSDYTALFGCGHAYHLECLSEPKSCYECLNTKGWASVATNASPPLPLANARSSQEIRPILPPAFMRNRDSSLRLAPPVPWPDLEGVL